MKIKLFFTTYMISLMGLLSIFFVFVNEFTKESGISIAALIMLVIFMVGVSSTVNFFASKKNIANIAVIAFSLIFLVIFRYRIVGGYMEIWNNIADAYSQYFKAPMYFATPSGKWLDDADAVMAVYFSMMFLAYIYPIFILSRKFLILPLFINTLFMVVSLVIEINIPVALVAVNIIFLLELFILSGISRHGSDDEKSSFIMQMTGIVVGLAVIIVFFIGTLIIEQDGYKKSDYFNKVGNYVGTIYKKIESKITGIGNKGTPVSNIGNGQRIVDNEKLGQLDKITYTGDELIRVTVDDAAKIVYIKQFIGKDYDDSTWSEPSKDELIESLGSVDDPKYTVRKLIRFELSDQYNVKKYGIKIDNTGLYKSRQLMPVYPYLSNDDNYDYDGYYKKLYSTLEIPFYSAGYDDITQLVRENYELNSWDDYTAYVHSAYLDVDESYREMFEDAYKRIKERDDLDSPFIIAEYTRQYLADRCEYTLSPGRLPKDADLIDYFYNSSKKGYCTYFASTAVAMLRSMNIPARYVSGFMVQTDVGIVDAYYVNDREKKNIISVTDEAAHAWVEFYVDNFGWVELDVTPGNFERRDVFKEEPTTALEPETTTERTTEYETTSAPHTTAGTEITTSLTGNKGGKKIHLSKTVIRNIFIISGIILILGLTVTVILVRHRYIITKEKLLYDDCRENDRKKCILLSYTKFERINAFTGYAREPGVLYADYAKKIEEESDFMWKNDSFVLMELFEKSRFSEGEITMEETVKAQNIVDELANKVYNNIGFFKKIQFRFIKNLMD